ncbi:hypothetical protein RHSIM_RhsimUnG0019400 [Rhododendron simsii]|uniref:4-alpha-glucanotransferase n=1 Tax=Rhododendron simsii TaxID=118357 RepID=A0A834L331_RHOSS|nr:hypothetical protein RHSIM_RhsimUnG0019400 [Rhododendron simsii]
MKSVGLSFRIPYNTQWGRSLVVCGSESVLGSWNVKRGLALSPQHQGDELIWCGSTAVPAGFECEYSYYVVDDDRNVLRWEAGKKRKLVLPEGLRDGEVVELHDLWQTSSDGLPCTSAFRNVIFRKIWSTEIQRLLGIYVIDSSTKLGQWKVQDGLKLYYAGDSIWQADCVVQKDDFPIKYLWLIEMPWRGVGVAVPMFSVRSEADLGVGEFLDLKILVDWAVESGFHLVQLLPINDTSVHRMWWDSYPYKY